MTDEKHLRLSDIKIGKRFRQDMGDIPELAESLKAGLLQPIGVTPKHELVFGERRLLAAKTLGWKTIPARIVDVPSILEGMLAENTMRKNYTVSERVAIYRAVKAEIGSRQGQRSDLELRDNCPEVEPGERTDDFAAKRAGLGNRKTAERAEKVVEGGVPSLVEAMDSGQMSISAAVEVASLKPKDQKSFLSHPVTHERMTAQKVRKYEKLRRIEKEQEKERRAILKLPKRGWAITDDQTVVPCDLVVTDPPQCILAQEKWDNPPEGIEAFTRGWCKRWSKCGANYIAIFWNQKTKWDAKRWFDESLEGYEFIQECCCHRRNYKKPEGIHGSHKKFRNSWEPVFVYRRKGFDRGITHSNHELGAELTDNDHHSASYPTLARNGDSFQQHKCQKPVSAFRWLIHGLTVPGEIVVDPFCGSGTAGIAAVQLGRHFHGIEIDREHRRIAEGRLAMFGMPPPVPNVRKPKINTVTHGDCLDLIPTLFERSIDLVLTSPAYAEQRKGQYTSTPACDYPEFTLRWMTALEPKLTANGSVLIVIRPDLKNGVVQDYVLRTRLLLRDFGWSECETLIWHKPDGGACFGSNKRPRRSYEEILWFSKTADPFIDVKACGNWSEDVSFRWSTRFGIGGKSPVHGGQNMVKRPGQTRIADVIEVPVAKIEKGIQHPAMFPTELAEILIKTFCPEGGTVLDPFAGSGTTLMAAAELGRKWLGFDIDAKFCELARQRVAKQAAMGKAG